MALYQYTTQARHNEIMRSGRFKASIETQEDATYGEGWHFTDLGPDECEKLIMQNCPQRETLQHRNKYFLRLQVGRAIVLRKSGHVYFVAAYPKTKFCVVEHGRVGQCPFKPCESCRKNPDK
ncbi:MAG: hypothetical protein ACYTFK_04070 [Planctomycetota bacterium]